MGWGDLLSPDQTITRHSNLANYIPGKGMCIVCLGSYCTAPGPHIGTYRPETTIKKLSILLCSIP